MNLNKFISRVNRTVKDAVNQGLITMDQVNSNSYLKSGFYFNTNIYIVTIQDLLTQPVLIPGEDITDFAFTMISREGIVVAFKTSNSVKLKRLNEKDFVTVSSGTKLLYGLDTFSPDFKYNDWIILVEGNRDCEDLKTIYPNVVATETAGLSSFGCELLKTLTSRLILGFDSDEPGVKARDRLLRYNKDFEYKTLSYGLYKDCGTLSELYLSDPFQYEYFHEYVLNQVKLLIGGN